MILGAITISIMTLRIEALGKMTLNITFMICRAQSATIKIVD